MSNKKSKKNKKNNIKTKKRLSKILIYFILILGLLGIYSYYIEPYRLIVKEYKVENKDIPDSFDGIKIAHFSDVHYGTKVDRKYLEKIINLINKQKPDIVIFTGDFIDKKTNLTDKEIEYIKESLSKINSNLGKYAVIGNHDTVHESDFKKVFDGSFTILNNEEKLIYYKESTPISLVGLTDSSETKIDYSLFEQESNLYRIVITHEPDEFNKIKDYNFNIQLSGHSHNGQIRLPLFGAIYTPIGAKTYFDEYYKIDNKEIFISNGIGTSTINARFNSTPSINVYRIYAY